MISNLFRPVIAGMLVITAMLLTLGRVRIVTNESSTDEISYALRVATQDATAVMVDRNHMMDGIEMDNGNFRINLDTADEQFLDSFYRNVGAAVSKSMRARFDYAYDAEAEAMEDITSRSYCKTSVGEFFAESFKAYILYALFDDIVPHP